MSNCFAFRFLEPGEDKRKSLALFLATESSVDLITKAVKADVEEYLVPKNVYILTFATNSKLLSDIKNDSSFLCEFDSFVGEAKEKLKLCCITNEGEIAEFGSEEKVIKELRRAILQAGMLRIFESRRGLNTSSLTYHFVKPSGDHCDKFIRASNLLISTDEVSLLAVSLLPYFNSKIKRIYVDTSSISYLISTAILLSGKFPSNLPLIESFESYAVFNQHYDFVEDDGSLVIVSATTSGSLVEKIIDNTSFRNSQIRTLFYSKLPAGQIGLFDISAAMPSNGITSLKPAECIFCQKGSRQIRIVGDQFLPETPKHDLLVIRKKDFQKNREDFFRQFATKGVLGWNTPSNNQAGSREHFYIDVGKVISSPPQDFTDALEKKLKKHFSLDVRTVISLNDAGSISLSNELKNKLGNNALSIEWLKLADLDKKPLQPDGASVVVVAGAITSGRTLLDVARRLRSLNKSASITYFIGFSKLPTSDSFAQLEKDLEQGGHDLVVLNKCPMPRVKEQTKTAWEWELHEMLKWSESDELAEHSDKLPEKLFNRMTALEIGTNDPNQLFLCSPNGHLLALRPTFAFWSDMKNLDTKKATQADVYWTVHAVIHDLRTRSDDKGLGSTYHTTLISPACFDRYNDGVIQASILRSASPAELNYAVDSDFSRKMTDVVRSIIEHWNVEQGEAALEFLIAIWTKRMQLEPAHAIEIENLCQEDMPEEMQFILRHLND
jgi:hypothetical protein